MRSCLSDESLSGTISRVCKGIDVDRTMSRIDRCQIDYFPLVHCESCIIVMSDRDIRISVHLVDPRELFRP